MAEKKITKKDMFERLRTLIPEDADDRDILIEFIDLQIGQIDKKAEKAKERAEKIKAEGDELRAAVEGALTNEWQTISDIIEVIDDETVTRAKISARLSALVKAGIADKEQRTVDGKRAMHYKLFGAD